MSEARIVLTTVAGVEDAETLATELLQQALAACVSIVGPIRSVYRWKGKIERAEEYLLLIKTTAELAAQLPAVLKSLHPYDLPECLEIPATGGSTEYLQWLEASVSRE